MRTHRSAITALAVAALLFGTSFVVIKDALTGFPPLAFVGWRFLVAGVVLAGLAFPGRPDLWRDGSIAGVLLAAGYFFQTIGLVSTSASNSALITGLYVVFTPLLVAALNRKAPDPVVSLGAMAAFVGIALLTAREGLRLSPGDSLTVAAAVGFAGHIAFLSRTAHRHPIIPYAAAQMLTVAALALLFSFMAEGPTLPTGGEWAPILVTGVGVSGLAYLLQIWAQTRLDAGRAALVLSLEPVFGVAAGALLLGERLAPRGWIGAVFVVVAIQVVLATNQDPATIEAELTGPE